MRPSAIALAALSTCLGMAACALDPPHDTGATSKSGGDAPVGTARAALKAPRETEAWELARMPSARSTTPFVYDPLRGQGMLFGDSFTDDRASTWSWNGFAFHEFPKRRVSASPAVRTSPSVAWDPVRQNVVLFGGSLSSGGLAADTWTWNGRQWTEVTGEPRPEPRTGAKLVWDDARKNLVLFGGQNAATFSSDTWTFDGTKWTYAFSNLPPGRTSTHAAWDPVRKNIVVFGGRSAQFLNDTWLWNGQDWRQAGTLGPPSPRDSATFTWDPVAKRLVLFGGTGPSGIVLGGALYFDGKNWSASAAGHPPPRADAVAAWDEARQAIVLFGGRDMSGAPLNDTWTSSGDTWTQVGTTGPRPTARWRSSLSWDPQRQSLFLLGGTSQFNDPNDAWYWNGTQWSAAASARRPPERSESPMVYDPVREQVVLFGGYSNSLGSFRGDTWVWNGRTWTEMTQPGPKPSARGGATLTWDAARKNVVMFGGLTFASVLADTWIWDGSRWTEKVSAVKPPARASAVAGFDPTAQAVVMAGGNDNSSFLTDVWLWDGSSWTQSGFSPSIGGNFFVMTTDEERKQLVLWDGGGRAWFFQGGFFRRDLSATPPTNMAQSTLAWDPIRKNVLLIGGGGTLMNVWAWNGVSWSDRSFLSSVRPTHRTNYRQFWDPARGVTVIAGGFGNIGNTDETWSYDGTNWTLIEPSTDEMDGFPSDSFAGDDILHVATKRALLFGESNNQGFAVPDTWTYHARGGACTTGAECASGSCVDNVCCEQAACGTCETCAAPSSPGRCSAVTLAEDADSCPASDHRTCNEDGRCTRTLGAECTQPSDCASGFCVSPFPGSPMVGPNKGLCCDRACNGQCEACAAGFKLSQKDDGVCGGAGVGTNPGFYCGSNLACNSAGECGPEPTAYCKDKGTAVDKVGHEIACGRYACERGVCLSRCANDSQCGIARRCSVDGYCDLLVDDGCSTTPGRRGNTGETATLGTFGLLLAASALGTWRKRPAHFRSRKRG